MGYESNTKNRRVRNYIHQDRENTTVQALRFIGRITKYVEQELNPNKLQVPDRGEIVATTQIGRAYQEVYLAIKRGEPQELLNVRVGTTVQKSEFPTVDDLLYRMARVKIGTGSNKYSRNPTFPNAIELLVEYGKKNGQPNVSKQRKDEVTEEVIKQRANGYNITLPEIVELLYRR